MPGKEGKVSYDITETDKPASKEALNKRKIICENTLLFPMGQSQG